MSRFLPFEVRGGMPAEGYIFTQGATEIAALTSGSVRKERPFFPPFYEPVAIRHESIEGSEERSAGGLKVWLPADDPVTNAVVDLYRGTVPTGVVEMALNRFHQGRPAVARIFFGEVASAEFAGAHCILTVEPKVAAFKQRALRMLYQGPCNHTLYDQFCGAVRANFSAAATVTAIASDNITLTVPVASSQPDGYYTGGLLQFGSRWGFIVDHTATTLVLMRPVPGLIVSASVTISAGCDRSIATCDAKFNNVVNHMGFPFIPTINPFLTGVGKTTP